MRLARFVIIVLALAALVVGGLVFFYGMFAVQVCSDPGGCRAEPTWPLVLLGLGATALSLAGLYRISRSNAGRN